MSRDGRDDIRDLQHTREVERTPPESRNARAHDDNLFSRHLDLPRGDTRERIEGRDRDYLLNEDETRALATIGAFRVVATDDLVRSGNGIDEASLRHLREDGLITRETLTDTAGLQHIVALTPQGRDLLEAHRHVDVRGPEQSFYAGIVKPRELAHDA